VLGLILIARFVVTMTDQRSQNEDYPGFIDKLEEGRIALHQLERHLKDTERAEQRREKNEDSTSVGSRQQSLRSERSLLDQVSRESRMHYRKDSPLGLTVEELDDRGLLDGGSVPKYYTSMRQRGRRPLELRKRGDRIQERDKESIDRSFDFFFHMIRTLAKRGVRIEEYCRQYDSADCGMVDRSRFLKMIKNMGLPLSQKDIQEITAKYTISGSDMVDFDKLLKDSRVQDTGEVFHQRSDFGEGEEDMTEQRACTGVLPDVKRMLIDSVSSLGKAVEDVWGLFARWDNEGSGTVTSTQFLRVLARLHVNLSDEDQDFLVELLDANAQGRVDFESLLSFCFAEKEKGKSSRGQGESGGKERSSGPSGNSQENSSPNAAPEDDVENGEALGAVSSDGLHEHKSLGSGQSNSGDRGRRPRTATDRDERQRRTIDRDKTKTDSGSRRSADGRPDGIESLETQAQAQASHPQRPLTASGRVSSTQEQRRSSPTKSDSLRGGDSDAREHIEVAVDPGDDNDDDGNGDEYLDVGRMADLPAFDSVEGASFNDNTLVTEQEHEELGTPTARGNGQQYRGPIDPWNTASLDGLTVSQDNLQIGDPESTYIGTQYVPGNPPMSMDGGNNSSIEATEHFRLLVDQTLASVRNLVISRHQSGHVLSEIFRHFDRKETGFFNAYDFMAACRDLHIEVSIEVARVAVETIAVDDPSAGNISLGEFWVFVFDRDYSKLETLVQVQLARQLEIQGRRFLGILQQTFWTEAGKVAGGRVQHHSGFVPKEAFVAGLSSLGLQILPADQQRLTSRYDIHGNGYCSVDRFLRNVQTSRDWTSVETNLNTLEEARIEAAELLRQINEGRQAPSMRGVGKEVVSMAEYLGIRPLSESHLLWIAVDALKAPLPISWIAQSDASGRTFFYNHVTRESSWDHPLDPYFRNMRDKYRREGLSSPTAGTNGRVADFTAGGGLHAPNQFPRGIVPRVGTTPNQFPLNLSIRHGQGPNPSASSSGNANIHQHQRPQSAQAHGSRSNQYQQSQGATQQQQQSNRVLPSVNGGTSKDQQQRVLPPSQHFSITHAAVQYAMAEQAPYMLKPDTNWVNEPAKTKGDRPVSAPSAAVRNKKGSDKTKSIYNSEYFNLSHYKQGGFNVEAVEAANRANHMPIGSKRPQSGGGGSRRSASALQTQQHQNTAPRVIDPRQVGRQMGDQHANNSAQHVAQYGQAASSFGAYGPSMPQHVAGAEERGTSVVDRAIFGTPVPMYLQPREVAKQFFPQPIKVTASSLHALLNQEDHHAGGIGDEDRLADMYGDNVLQRLDQAVRRGHDHQQQHYTPSMGNGHANGSNSQQQQQQQQQSSHKSRAKPQAKTGGIVII